MERTEIRHGDHAAFVPGYAEPVIGRRFALTRWLHPGYRPSLNQ